MKRISGAKYMHRTTRWQHVVEKNADRSRNQKREHHRQGIFLFSAQLCGVDQGQRQRQRDVNDQADKPQPQPLPEELPHEKAKLHAQAAIERVEEQIESLGMKSFGDIEQRGGHVFRTYKKHGGKESIEQKFAVVAF